MIFREGGYLAPQDLHSAKRILTAPALTSVASSFFSLVNMWRWIRRVRRKVELGDKFDKSGTDKPIENGQSSFRRQA